MKKAKKEVSAVLVTLTEGIIKILKENVIGIYLTGSLSDGTFTPETSDIDLFVVFNKPLTDNHLQELASFHQQVENLHKNWTKRIECSYIPRDFLSSIQPPKTPRPYCNEGIFYPEAPYGNEWIINLYALYQSGITLKGLDFKKLIKPVDILEVRAACIRDLTEAWQPKIQNPDYLKSSHHQAYAVLTLCRIFYTLIFDDIVSKKYAAAWVKKEFSQQCKPMIETAENWRPGMEINLQEDIVAFFSLVVAASEL